MSELRWILICFGALVLIAIYVWGRRASRRASAPSDALVIKPEPQFAPERSDDVLPQMTVSTAAFQSTSGTMDEEPAPPASWKAQPAVTPSRDLPTRDSRRNRVEPTFSDDVSVEESAPRPVSHEVDEVDDEAALTAELPVREPADAPTLSMSSTPLPRRIERRKIISLRLAASQRYSGEQLRQALEAESLQHGKYDVFHRLHEGASVFSAASMVEPGTFELERMAGLSYPGVTLFAQLPGPLPGVHALNDLVACGKQLQQTLGGTLQDERGVPLTVHRIDRLRQEIVEFERGHARETRNSSPAH